MASKQYISIIRLFEHCGISAGDDFNLSRAKKQLQAEFGIAQNGFIEVNGFNYSRQDVMEEIDRPDFMQRLVFHQKVWQQKQVLTLLEKNTADLKTIKEEFSPFWNNQAFDEFFSPYFAGPFSYISRNLLAAGKLTELGNLLAYEEFLLPAEREEAYRPIRIFLDENFRLLRNINGENYDIMRPKITHWIDTDWHLFFNNLPHEFYEIKNDIITRLINIGVAVQKSHKPDCRSVSIQLIALTDTPESLRQVIVSNHAVYMGGGSSRSSGSSSWRVILWILWIGFMISRMSGDGCNGSNSNYEYIRPSDIRYYPSTDTLYKILQQDTDIARATDSTLKNQPVHIRKVKKKH